MRYNPDGLFPALDAALKAASAPMTSQQLYEIASVRETAASVNRVSDYLGNMWRKGQVMRTPAPQSPDDRSRWAYSWKGSKAAKVYANVAVEHMPRVIADRPSVLITEEGNVMTLEFPNLIIQIRQKNGK
jgi:hypothetical protein